MQMNKYVDAMQVSRARRRGGFSLQEFASQMFANKEDTGKGRQMPGHFGSTTTSPSHRLQRKNGACVCMIVLFTSVYSHDYVVFH